MVIQFSVSSKPRCRAEFEYIESGLLFGKFSANDIPDKFSTSLKSKQTEN